MTHTARGVLVVAATPIGDPADASPRLGRELTRADVIAAEDTRKLRRLAGSLGVDLGGRVRSYFEGNEAVRTRELVADLERGRRVVLVTDAGMPTVSDPGYRLVRAAADAGLTVTAVPGPSAVPTALAVSGLAVDRFCFEGFPPRRAGDRRRRLARLAGEERTMVFFESRHRLAATLAVMSDVLGASRPAVVCRELTKTHEQVQRGTLAELADWAAAGDVLGEITIVVAGAEAAPTVTVADAVALVADEVAGGASRKDAIAAVAKETGLPRRRLYQAVIGSTSDPPSKI